MMARIYGQATSVCVWIGEVNEDSKIALDFMKNEVLRLQDFDELCENQAASPKWRAMLNVMKSSWFSRRWVVQEIALAKEATIYCGKDTISWKDFSDAVQLFVEVETATHRLSEVMKKDPKFYHIPGWFEYVSALGASLLVNATGTLFRKTKDEDRALLSLEYLVSSMTVFQATVPHDTIYSLLAIAKDTSPKAITSIESQTSRVAAQDQLEAWAMSHQTAKPYNVDYQQPLVDVCQEFIAFCIRQSDRTRALDIICRPWAPIFESKIEKERKKQKGHKEPRHIKVNEEFDKMPTWIPTLSGAAHAMFPHASGELRMGRRNADPLVGLPESTQRNYSAAGTTEVNMRSLRFRKYKRYYSMFISGFVRDTVSIVMEHSQSGNIPEEWIEQGRWTDFTKDPPEELWRTLVADRGRNSKNPPTYYARAFKVSINKGLRSGSLNTTELIEHGRCSVVAEFFRRVQAVIWNRSLMRTENDALGIVNKNVRAGDLVCVLYGCSVPVILRRHRKSDEEVAEEMAEEEAEYEKTRLQAAIKLQRFFRQRKLRRKTDATRLEKEHEGLQLWKTNELLGDRRSETITSLPQNKVRAVPDSRTSLSNQEYVEAISKAETETESFGELNSEPGSLGPEGPSASDLKNTSKPIPPPKPATLTKPVAPTETAEPDKVRVKAKPFWYEFLGECYVYGMMDAEAIKYKAHKEIPSEVFELR